MIGRMNQPLLELAHKTFAQEQDVFGDEVKITFAVSGYVTQRVHLKYGVDPKELERKLSSGEAATTIQEDGDVIIVENGEVLGTVKDVDNNCEYDDFDVEINE